VEKKLAMMKAAEDEWLELAEDHDAEQAAQLEEQVCTPKHEDNSSGVPLCRYGYGCGC
jgi:hypothetical protein